MSRQLGFEFTSSSHPCQAPVGKTACHLLRNSLDGLNAKGQTIHHHSACACRSTCKPFAVARADRRPIHETLTFVRTSRASEDACRLSPCSPSLAGVGPRPGSCYANRRAGRYHHWHRGPQPAYQPVAQRNRSLASAWDDRCTLHADGIHRFAAFGLADVVTLATGARGSTKSLNLVPAPPAVKWCGRGRSRMIARPHILNCYYCSRHWSRAVDFGGLSPNRRLVNDLGRVQGMPHAK